MSGEVTREQVEKVLRQEGIDPSDKERVKYVAERATDLKKIDDELKHELQNAQKKLFKEGSELKF